jgi:hypothetical protein
MNIDKTIEENINQAYLKGERTGFIQAFVLMLSILFIPCGYIIIDKSDKEFDKQVNKYLYEKIASDCQAKIDSIANVESFVITSDIKK